VVIKTEILKIIRRRTFIFSFLLMILVNTLLHIIPQNNLRVPNSSDLTNLINHFGLWYIIGFVIIVGLAPVISEEYSSGVDNFLLCCKRGRNRLVTYKIVAAATFIIAIALIFICMDFLFYVFNNNLAGVYISIKGIRIFRSSPYSFSVLVLLLAILFIKMLGAIELGILVLFISAISRSSMLTFIISGLVLYLPTMITKDSLFYWFIEFSYKKIINASDFFINIKYYQIFKLKLSQLNITILIFFVLSVLFIYFTYYGYLTHKTLDTNIED
jgi:ABC-type transport system involved in multi-copper enzyme maturation permease subunit